MLKNSRNPGIFLLWNERPFRADLFLEATETTKIKPLQPFKSFLATNLKISPADRCRLSIRNLRTQYGEREECKVLINISNWVLLSGKRVVCSGNCKGHFTRNQLNENLSNPFYKRDLFKLTGDFNWNHGTCSPGGGLGLVRFFIFFSVEDRFFFSFFGSFQYRGKSIHFHQHLNSQSLASWGVRLSKNHCLLWFVKLFLAIKSASITP